MPAALAVRCPECRKDLKLKASAAGRIVKCPGCGGKVKVPAADGGGVTGDTGDFLAALPKASKPTKLPARVTGGPSSAEVPAYLDDGPAKKPRKEPTSPAVVAASIGGGVLALLLAAGGVWWMIFSDRPDAPDGGSPPPAAAAGDSG